MTIVPPVGAALDRVTVHVAAVPEVRLLGVHCSPETAGSTLIDPPVPVMFASVPSGSVPITLLIGKESTLAPLLAERVAVTVASVPLLMAVAFVPDATHTNVPTPELQLSVFPGGGQRRSGDCAKRGNIGSRIRQRPLHTRGGPGRCIQGKGQRQRTAFERSPGRQT